MTTAEHVTGQLDLNGQPVPSEADWEARVARIDAAPPAPESHGQPLALLLRLEALREAATPGEWEAEICEGELTVSAGTARTAWTDHDGFRTGRPASSYRSTDRIYEHDLDSWDADTPDDKQREADADLIVAAVNHLPKLTAALRAVLALADASDQRVRDSVPASGAESLIASGLNLVRVGELRTAIREALA